VGALNVVVNKGRVAVKDMIEDFTPALKEAAHDVGLALG